jgi:hypothetical protein
MERRPEKVDEKSSKRSKTEDDREFWCRAINFQATKLRMQSIQIAAFNNDRLKPIVVCVGGFQRMYDSTRKEVLAFVEEPDPRKRVCDGLEVFTIGADHTVVGLRGQQGVRTTRLIKRNTVLAEYYGEWLSEAEAQKRQDTSRYLFDVEVTAKGLPTVWQTVDAERGNGLAEFFNDYRIDVNRKDNDLKRMNALMFTIRYRGETFLFVAALEDIPAGAEVLVDYGEAYWAK